MMKVLGMQARPAQVLAKNEESTMDAKGLRW